MKTVDEPSYSRRTTLAAIDMLNRLSQADLTRFLLDLGRDVARQVGEGGGVKGRLNKLIKYYDDGFLSDAVTDDGTPVRDAIIAKAVSLLPHWEAYQWSTPPELPEDELVFRRALERDGFTATEKTLHRTLPVEVQLPEAETEIERLLGKHGFHVPRGHLDQARDAHARGNWAAANSQLRSFIEGLLDEIAFRIDPSAGVGTSENRRAKLGAVGFLRADLNEWSSDGKNFINGLIKRLHPQGSHPGLSGNEDSTFRLHVVMLTARLLLTRFDMVPQP